MKLVPTRYAMMETRQILSGICNKLPQIEKKKKKKKKKKSHSDGDDGLMLYVLLNIIYETS